VQRSRIFIMNQQTWDAVLMPESLEVNAAGAMVAAANGTFPVLGGSIEFLDFIPYGDIVGGYLEKYLLVEREGASMAVSEHVRFIEEQTVFKGTARYDGVPVRPAAFFAMNVLNANPTTAVTFAPDTANVVTP
jgi:HK97 family phage major capsid protein